MSGASIGISRQIFEDLGITVNITYEGPWKRVLKSAQQGKIDFIPALKKNLERQAYLTFTSVDFASNPVAVFVRKGELQNVSAIEGLSDKNGSINAGNRHGSDIDRFVEKQLTMQHIHGISQNFKMLELFRTDYFITGLFVGTDYLAANKLEQKFDIALKINGPKVHNAFTHAFADSCQQVVVEFEQALRVFKHQGRVRKAISEYNNIWVSKKVSKATAEL